MYQKSCKNGSSSHLSDDSAVTTTTTVVCNNDESAVDRLISEKAKVGTFKMSISSEGVLGPKLFFVTGLVMFATAVARLVCPDLLG